VSDTNHTDYQSGMSEWCSNCHSGFTGFGSGNHTHPAGANGGQLGTTISGFYNKYKETGVFTDTSANSYDSLVPFERASATAAQLSASSTTGPTASDQVMCLSCHRAHATGFSDIGRWDFRAELLSESPIFDPTTGLGETLGDIAYYNKVSSTGTAFYGTQQRSLCNKCHLQD
jgi:hypothetical protein